MLNDILKKLLYSFGITALVSVLGRLFCMNFGFNFWITSSFLFLLQIVGFYFYGEHVKRKNAFIQAKLELDAITELRKISVDVVCPCDKKAQTTIPLDMNTDNSYICSQCAKKVGVILDVKTVLKTEPIQEDPLRNPQIIKDVEEALKDPRHNDRI
jgi:hypothetical protein